jgi:DNA-binding MarR family transcriptional regulator
MDDLSIIEVQSDLPDFPSKKSIPYQTLLLSRLMMADFLARLGETGIAPAQAFVLRELWREEPLSQVEISQRLDIGKATVGQSLKRLERNGYVERRRSSTDARVVVVQLTAKGHALRAPLGQAARAQVAEIAAVLGPVDAENLARLLDKLVVDQRARVGRPEPDWD